VPREYGIVNVTIWSDPDFQRLPPAAQHLYLLLWTSPSLSYCGVHDWRPGRLAERSHGFTGDHIRTIADCLAARHFVVIDEGTEEILIRSWARWDGLLKKPRMAISFLKAYTDTASKELRAVMVHELVKCRQHNPELKTWEDERVRDVLTHPSLSAKTLSTPDDPFAMGFASGFEMGLPQTSPGVCQPPTPTTATSPLLHIGALGSADASDAAAAPPNKDAKKKPATALPATWKPNSRHHEFAIANQLDISAEVERFRDHAEANDRRQANWDASFRMWLTAAIKFRGRAAGPTTTGGSTSQGTYLTADQLAELGDPPDDPDELRDWWERRRAMGERR